MLHASLPGSQECVQESHAYSGLFPLYSVAETKTSSNCVLFVCMVSSLKIKDLKLFALPKLVVPAEKVPRMEPGVISDLV